MPGRPGRSGGSNRLPLEAHLARGTFRATEHAHRMPAGPAWDPTPEQLAALGDEGRAFVARVLAGYVVGALEGELALEGAHAVDRLAAVRAQRHRAAGKRLAALDRQELAWTRVLSGCVLALRARLLQPRTEAPASKWGVAV